MQIRIAIFCFLFIISSIFLSADEKQSNANSRSSQSENNTTAKESDNQQKNEAETLDTAKKESDTEADQTSKKNELPTESDKNTSEKKEALKTNKLSGFSSIEDTGLTLADNDTWYYEEFDSLGRPSLAVLYSGANLAEKTEWKYESESLYPYSQTVTKDKQHVMTKYSAAGFLILKEVYNADKGLEQKIENTYNAKNELVSREETKGDVLYRREWTYEKGKKKSEIVYRNTVLQARIYFFDSYKMVHVYENDKEILKLKEALKEDR
ncbi:hypothetical protein [Treponema phagedenis]|uniref:Uncharacterized protein n=1 Tax=Treponema phagedenis TaxID=162 RepID=A0AAE6IUP7_TREPH|nr:hypothetical protein [Treponema phagedenis]QEJ98215.1 hypothetical protein FUT82_09535 [Treponema phagedenis]QEK03725.1 hypothetical protein FUT83_07850 [Treponema phagedenis]QEK06044.1 hypothetical protein FUT80_04540 [Treponema phagedenis]QEK09341.1 hypothetical protein FUT81_07760 [Treponema phagedenis]QSH94558.1 hypothetical protein C5O78_05795 [Treponema phagedenis]